MNKFITDQYKLVMIEWVDASRLSDSWIDMNSVPDAYVHKCKTVGFLVSESDAALIVVPTIADIEHPDNSHTYGGMLIPRCSVLSERLISVS